MRYLAGNKLCWGTKLNTHIITANSLAVDVIDCTQNIATANCTCARNLNGNGTETYIYMIIVSKLKYALHCTSQTYIQQVDVKDKQSHMYVTGKNQIIHQRRKVQI